MSRKLLISFLFFVILLGELCLASSNFINMQLRIMKPNGEPLESPSVDYTFVYKSHDGQCIIYEENFTGVPMTGTKGNASFQLGSGIRTYPGIGELKEIFNNYPSVPFSCKPGSALVTYSNISSQANRLIDLKFNDHGTYGEQTLSNIVVNSIPAAWYADQARSAQLFSGLPISDFLRFTDFTGSCNSGEYLRYDASGSPKLSCAAPSISGGTITSVAKAVGSPIDITGTATDPVIGIMQADSTHDGYITSATFTDIENSKTDLSQATHLPTPNRIVKRDGTGSAQFNNLTADGLSLNQGYLYSGTDYVRVVAPVGVSNYTFTFPQNAGSANYVLATDGNGLTSWVPAASGSVTNVTASLPLSSSGGATPNITVATANTTTSGVLSSADWNSFNSKLGPATTFSGDVSGTYNSTSVDKIKNVDVTYSTLTSGNFLKYNGAAWVNSLLQLTDIPNMDAAHMPALTGDVTTSVGSTATTINNLARAKLASGSNDHVLINNGSGVMSSEAQLAISRGGTGASTFTPEGLIMAGATGSSPLASKTCLIGEVLQWNGTTWACVNSSNLSMNTMQIRTVRVATNANITLSGTQTIDGVALVAGDRVLVKNQQLNPEKNGVYVVSAGAWTRAVDMDSWTEAVGYRVLVLEGSNYAGILFNSSSLVTGILESSGIYWTSMGVTNRSGGVNLIFGQYALQSNTTGAYNIAIGSTALSLNTTGINNVALGDRSLEANTSGGYNTAIGSEAMKDNTVGTENAALGRTALQSNTTGSYNTAFGSSALRANTTGTYNVAVGQSALRSSTTGAANISVGVGALQNNTTGGSNIAIGREALYNNVGKNESTAIGFQAMVNAHNTSSNVITYNTAIGATALRGSGTPANNTGVRNTALGHSALYGMSSGSGNLGVGYNAGSAITTGSHNVVIGSNTGSSIATSSNNIIIADGAGTERIKVDSLGNIGIGTSNPSGVLDINKDQADFTRLVLSNNNTPSGLLQSGTSLKFMMGNTYVGSNFVDNFDLSYNIGTQTATPLNFITGMIERMRVTDTGRVGIGTSNPNYKLDVDGDINVTGSFRVNGTPLSGGGASEWSKTGSNLHYNSGYVGIGSAITNPTDYLTIEENQSGNTVASIRNNNSNGQSLMQFHNDNGLIGEIGSVGSGVGGGPWTNTLSMYTYPGADGISIMTDQWGDPIILSNGSSQALTVQNGKIGVNGPISNFTGTFQGDDSNEYSGSITLVNNTANASPGMNIRHSTGGADIRIKSNTGEAILDGFMVLSTENTLNGITLATGFADPIIFANGGSTPSETMRINGNGRVGIGTNNPSEQLHVVGNLRVQGSTNCILGAGSGATNCTSDARLKTNVKEIPNALDKILSLRGVEFDWNEKALTPGRHDIGVIAQEVEKVFPSTVITDHSTGYKMVDYAALVSPLIQSVKQIHGQCRQYEKDLLSLKQQNEFLMKENKEMNEKIEKIMSELRKLAVRK